MKSGFLDCLDFHLQLDSDVIGVLDSPLRYWSAMLDCMVELPVGFESDGSSVPRIPFVYIRLGSRSPREGWLHDYLYRTDSVPVVSRPVADAVFKEAMTARGKPVDVRWMMWIGVRIGGWLWYHKRSVMGG